ETVEDEGGEGGAFRQGGGDQVFVGGVDGAAAHAHRVDHGDAAGGDVVAVADAAARLKINGLAEIGAAAPNEIEECLGAGIDRLGRARDAAMEADRDLV